MDAFNISRELKKLNINGLADDTRYLEPGDAFICRKGKNYNGHDFVIEAVFKGAKAVISETPIETVVVPVFLCDDIEKCFGTLLTEIYGAPWENVRLIGITGTDGKTTTASIIEHLFNRVWSCGYIGTNGIRYSGVSAESNYTTLPLCHLVKTLKKMELKNIAYCALEISSQGLVDKRLEGVEFDIAVFTNLSTEHLDTHLTMENYFRAKAQLFSKLKPEGLAIVNIDSPYGHRINSPKLITYGIDYISDFRALNIKKEGGGVRFDLKTPDSFIKNIKTNLTGKYNVYNAVAAMVCARERGLPWEIIIKAIGEIPKIPGRMELLTKDENFQVYVDFAHTPGALRAVLMSLKSKSGRIIIVLGAAGNKDKSKRPEMGKIACTYADHVIFTSEDPRNENPSAIIKEMTRATAARNYEIIINRKTAIREAISRTKAGDIVIITGKGNDKYFEENNKVYAYSDIAEVRKALGERKKRG